MGFRVLAFSFLMIFVYFSEPASSHPNQKTLPSEFVQRRQLEDEGIYGRKLEGGGAHGGSHGGQSHGGGGAVMPIYAAGAAKQHQSHRGAACNLNKIKISTMFMMTFCLFSHTVFLLI
ncbi:uncharacterized protein LOC130718608 [Lotus japonicus]|uniref:Glycine-rich protein n=1 Tax=Lotus japonicus TaxID=34305 RepID=I3S980_LOTJA|nr:uncharacterized protein LOC130718608 [Lotus japonicus]AFK36822.1 unknown [Lotus japonicus]